MISDVSRKGRHEASSSIVTIVVVITRKQVNKQIHSDNINIKRVTALGVRIITPCHGI